MKLKSNRRARNQRGRRGVLIEMDETKAQLPSRRPQDNNRVKKKDGMSPRSRRPFRLKKILVPLDFSECSKKSLQYAVPFARRFGASLTLLHIIQPYYPAADMIPMDSLLFERRVRESSEAELESIRKSLAPELKAKTIMRLGTPHVEIVVAAREMNTDLIVLSTHGRTGLAHVLMGSTAERVVRHANCPVMVLREHEHEFVER